MHVNDLKSCVLKVLKKIKKNNYFKGNLQCIKKAFFCSLARGGIVTNVVTYYSVRIIASTTYVMCL